MFIFRSQYKFFQEFFSKKSLDHFLSIELFLLIILEVSSDVLMFLSNTQSFSTSPGGNTQQDTNYMATCPLSRKLFKLDEPEMQDIAGEAEMNSWEMYSYGSPHTIAQKQD